MQYAKKKENDVHYRCEEINKQKNKKKTLGPFYLYRGYGIAKGSLPNLFFSIFTQALSDK